jgi:site-specific recombinase XerD
MTYHDQKRKDTVRKINNTKELLPEFAAEFLSSLMNSKELSTVAVYGENLRIFFHYLISSGLSKASQSEDITIEEIRNVKPRDIESFLLYLEDYLYNGRTRHNGGSGKKAKLATVKMFYKFLIMSELTEINPADIVAMPKVHRKPIIVLEKEEVEDMFSAITTNDFFSGRALEYHEEEKERDEAIITFFLGTGVRVSELVGLDLDDIDLPRRKATVTRKGGNVEEVYFSEDVKDALVRYIKGSRRDYEPKDSSKNALFLSRKHNRISVRAVQVLVKKYATLIVGEGNKISPHKMRSTYGTALYEETGDIELTSKALGHRSLNVTSEHYVRFPEDRKKLAARSVRSGGKKH